MGTGVEFTIRWGPRRSSNDCPLARKGHYKFISFCGKESRQFSKWVVLNRYAKGTKLVGIHQRVVHFVAHPDRFVEDKNRRRRRLRIVVCRRCLNDWHTLDRRIRVCVRRDVAFPSRVMKNGAIRSTNNSVGVRIHLDLVVNDRSLAVASGSILLTGCKPRNTPSVSRGESRHRPFIIVAPPENLK